MKVGVPRRGEGAPRATELPLPRSRLDAAASLFGERLSQDEVDRLNHFVALLLEWNAHINVSGARSAEDIVDEHLIDVFAARRFCAAGARAVDVGSGGGLPAIPLAVLAPGVAFDLFEPTAKKAAFLRMCVRTLGLGERVRVHAMRVLPRRSPAGQGGGDGVADSDGVRAYDLAISRATFSPPTWLELGLGLVRPGGRVMVFSTTEDGLGARPEASAEVRYGRNRRLLIYEAS